MPMMSNAALRRAAEVIADPARFSALVQVVTKGGKRVPLRFNRVQRAFLSQVRLGERVTHVVVKPRQVGMTTALHALNLHTALTRPDTRIMTLFDRQDNTDPARKVVDLMYQTLPARIDLGDGVTVRRPTQSTDNATTRRFENGSSWVLATAGAKTAGRSRTLDIFHGSEVAYWQDPESIASGALVAAEFAQLRVLESTANGAGGWFYDLAMRAADGDPALRLHFFPWWWSPEYAMPAEPDFTPDAEELELMRAHGLTPEQITWRREKVRGHKHLFQQEYPEDVRTAFVRSGFGYFGDIDAAYCAPLNPTPTSGHEYVAGIDWGQQDDYTAMVVIDRTTGEMVDMLRVKQASWAAMRADIWRMVKRWGVRQAVAESNSMGSSQIEALRDELSGGGVSCAVSAFTMTASAKPPLMQSLRLALAEGALKVQNLPVLRHELGAAMAVQRGGVWTVESPRDAHGHGDTVVALALAWRCAGVHVSWDVSREVVVW